MLSHVRTILDNSITLFSSSTLEYLLPAFLRWRCALHVTTLTGVAAVQPNNFSDSELLNYWHGQQNSYGHSRNRLASKSESTDGVYIKGYAVTLVYGVKSRLRVAIKKEGVNKRHFFSLGAVWKRWSTSLCYGVRFSGRPADTQTYCLVANNRYTLPWWHLAFCCNFLTTVWVRWNANGALEQQGTKL